MKYSILIPAYKDKYLKECIASCLQQTYDNYEIIIVNDHSPHDLDTIVNQFNDDRIHYYKNEIRFGAEHVVGNWNKCLEYASGDYVMCIGDDDRLKPNCLEDYTNLIKKHPDLHIYHTRMEIIDEQSRVITIQEDRPETESAYSMIWHFWHGRRQVIGDWLFNTEHLKKRGGFISFPYGWNSDNISAFAMAAEQGVANTHYPGFQYRETSINITSKHTSDAVKGKIRAWKEARKWYETFLRDVKPHNDIDEIYRNDIINLLDRYFHRKEEAEIEHGISDFPYSIISWMKLQKETSISKANILKITLSRLLKSIL